MASLLLVMGFLRIRLVGLAVFTLSVQIATLAAALSATCCTTDPHDASDSLVCNMPHEPGATCPMHHAALPSDPDSHGPTDGTAAEALLTCNCSPLFGIVALQETVGVVAAADTFPNALTPVGDVAVDDATPLSPAVQVSSPPPRS